MALEVTRHSNDAPPTSTRHRANRCPRTSAIPPVSLFLLPCAMRHQTPHANRCPRTSAIPVSIFLLPCAMRHHADRYPRTPVIPDFTSYHRAPPTIVIPVAVHSAPALLRWPWRSRVIPMTLLLLPRVIVPIAVLAPPPFHQCRSSYFHALCVIMPIALSSHLRHSSVYLPTSMRYALCVIMPIAILVPPSFQFL